MASRKLKVLLLAAGIAVLPLAAPAAPAKVQAGGPLVNASGQAVCTFNFIFRSGAKSYVGTAAHCAEAGRAGLVVGDRVRAGDPDSPLGRFGPATEIGTVVAAEGDLDFALIAIDDGVEAVSKVRGWGGPTGNAIAKTGDIVFFTGYGLGPGETALTRHRAGVVISSDTEKQSTDIPVSLGDSGGPLLDGQGRAIGIISRLSASGATTESGPTVAAILNRMTARGYALTIVGASFSKVPSYTS